MGNGISSAALEESLPPTLDYNYFKEFAKEEWSPELFDALKDDNTNLIDRSELLKKLYTRTHVFLSHDVERDEFGRSNVERVKRVNDWLRARGIVTWFRGDQRNTFSFSTKNIDQRTKKTPIQQHFHGIEKCGLVIVFVTNAYMDKVGGKHGENDDICREFHASCHIKTYKNMISVVNETRCREIWKWKGPVGLCGGNLSCFNDKDDDKIFEEEMKKLWKRIKKKIDRVYFVDVAREHGIDPDITLSKSGQLIASRHLTPLVAPITPRQRQCEEHLFQWLLIHCGPMMEETVPEDRMHQASLLFLDLYTEADQATLQRVSKRVDKEPIWLSSLATWLRSLVDMELEVKAMREELDERNRLQIAILNEFKRKQEEEIAAYLKAQAEQDERDNGAKRIAAAEAAKAAREAMARFEKSKLDFLNTKLEFLTGVCDQTFKGHSRLVMSVMQLREGGNNALLISGSTDASIKLWDVTKQGYAACVKTFYGHHGAINQVVQLTDQLICSTSRDGTMKVWNLSQDGYDAQWKTMQGYVGGFLGVIHLTSGKGVKLMGPPKPELSVSEKESHAELVALGFELAAPGQGPGQGPTDSGLVASAGADGAVRVWEYVSGTCLKTMMGHVGEVTSIIELTQSNKIIASQSPGQPQDPSQIDKCFLLCTTGEDATVRIWSPVGINGRMISVLRGHTNNVMCVIELLHPTTYPPPPATERSSINTSTAKRTGIAKGDSRRASQGDSRKGSQGSQRSLNSSLGSLDSLSRRSEGSVYGEMLGMGAVLKGSGGGGEGAFMSSGRSSTGLGLSQNTAGEMDQKQDIHDHHGDFNHEFPAEESEIVVHDDGGSSSISVNEVHRIGEGNLTRPTSGRSNVSRRNVHMHTSLDSYETDNRYQEEEQSQHHHHSSSDRSNSNNNNNNHNHNSRNSHNNSSTNNHNQTLITYSDDLALALAQMDSEVNRALICSGSYDRTIRIWHWPTGRCLRVLRVGKNVHSITQLRNGRICVAGDDNIITIWNWITGVREMTLEGHGNYVRSLIQLADGRLCSGSMDNTLKLWK